MGHQVRYFDFKVDTPKNKMIDYINDECNQDADYPDSIGHLRVPTEIVFNNYEAAQQYITDADKGWYDQIAVKYYETVQKKPTKQILEMTEKCRIAFDEFHKLDFMPYSEMTKAEFIGCKHCNSKLNRNYMRFDRYCPLCKKDLRSDTFLKRLENKKKRLTTLQAALKTMEEANSTRGEVRWLCKVEYHV